MSGGVLCGTGKVSLSAPQTQSPSDPKRLIHLQNSLSPATNACVSLKIFDFFHPEVFPVTSVQDTPPLLSKNSCFPLLRLKKLFLFITCGGFRRELCITTFFANSPVNKVFITLLKD